MAEPSLDELWPDPDRRDSALERLLARVVVDEQRDNDPDAFTAARTHELERLRKRVPTPPELRALTAISHGLQSAEAAFVLGYTPRGMEEKLRNVRRKLRAKNTAHAVALALRAGFIR